MRTPLALQPCTYAHDSAVRGHRGPLQTCPLYHELVVSCSCSALADQADIRLLLSLLVFFDVSSTSHSPPTVSIVPCYTMIMDWSIPPGPKFLLSNYHVFVFPPLATYLLLWVLSSTLSYQIHGVVRVFLPLLAIPVFCLARIQANEWHRSIKARRSGGRLPKLIPHKWPGGIDLLLDMQRKQNTIYPGILIC